MRLGPDGGVFYELVEDHVAVQSVGGHSHRLLRYLWRVTCPQLVDERPVGRPPIARDPSFAQPEVGDAGTAIGVGWVECSGALRSLAGRGTARYRRRSTFSDMVSSQITSSGRSSAYRCPG